MSSFLSVTALFSRSRPSRILALGLMLGSALSCASGTTETGKSAAAAGKAALPNVAAPPPELTSDGLQLVQSTKRTRLWVKPDHHLGRYDFVMIAGIGFAYGKGQESLDNDQEDQIGEMLKNAIGGITKSGPVGAAAEPGSCVVAVQLGLRDLVLHINDKPSGSSISFVSSFGSATMVIEFRDSTTDVPLVRYIVNRGLGGGPGTGQLGANLDRLGRTLGEMVTDMTTELQTIVPTTTVRPETECQNGIYKLTGRG